MKSLIDITIICVTLWIGLFKLLNPLGQNSDDSPEFVEGEPAMVITETVSPEQLEQQEKLAASLRAAEEAKQQEAAHAIAAESQLKDERDASQHAAVAAAKLKDEADKLKHDLKGASEAAAATAAKLRAEVDKLKTEPIKVITKPDPEIIKRLEAAEQQVKRLQSDAATPKVPDEPRPIKPPAKDALHWSSNLERAVADGRRLDRNVFIDFEGEGCTPCRQLALNVYNSSEVSGRLRTEFVPVWLYSTRQNDNHRSEFMTKADKASGTVSFPMAVVLHPDGSWSWFEPSYDTRKSRSENIADFLSDLDDASK
jgi:hypothetical protein